MAQPRQSETQTLQDNAYLYALRVAYLIHLLRPPVDPLPVPSTSSSAASGPDKVPWRNSLSNSAFSSIGDLLKDVGSSKSNKYPEKLIKVLGARIQAIATHKDPTYSDPVFRSTIGAFYGTYTSSSFNRQMKDSRKVEEIILAFVTSAQNVLKRRAQSDEWKWQLMECVGLMVCLIRDCLKDIRGVSPELMQRLDMYKTKLQPDPASPNPKSLPSAPKKPSSDSTFVVHVLRAFGLPDSQSISQIPMLERDCSIVAAARDLKLTMKIITQCEPPFYQPQDFFTEHAYQNWRKSELDILQNMFVSLMQNQSNNSDLSSLADSKLSDDPSLIHFSFTFVPTWPRTIYRFLHGAFLDYDLEVLRNLPAEEEVSVKILSRQSQELLHECASRWSIASSSRAVIHFDEICERYSVDAIPLLQCVEAAYRDVERAAMDFQYDLWPIEDHDAFLKTLCKIHDTLLRRFYELVQAFEALDDDDIVQLATNLMAIQSNDLFFNAVTDFDARIDELRNALVDAAAHRYLEWTRMNAVHPIASLQNLLDSVSKIISSTRLLKKKFKTPIINAIRPPVLFLEKTASLFAADLHSIRDQLVHDLNDDSNNPGYEDDYREFYFTVLDLMKLYAQICPKSEISIELSWVFEPYVRKWMARTEAKTMEWVANAISIDKFVPEGADRHSSSIMDLMDSCSSAYEFIQDLKWPDPIENAVFSSSLARIISKSIEEYCNTVEQLFLQEVSSKDEHNATRNDEESTHAWIMKAKGLYSGSGKPEAFEFRPESCVKLNNIQAARELVDKMYSKMDVDSVAETLSNQPKSSKSTTPSRFLFTIKVVIGEDLLGVDETTSVDPFLTLSDENGHRVAKTRTLYETPDPRWNESFDIVVDGPKWLAATVYDRNIVEEHDMLGRAFFRLDPKNFGDFLPQELWLDLDRHGRVLLRVSMEGDEDDIRFYFGRTFRSLKRAETDMTRMIVDKVSPFVRQFLSRNVLKSLVKKSNFTFEIPSNLNMKAGLKDLKLEKVTSYFQRTQISQSEIPPVPVHEEIPPPPSSNTAAKRRGSKELTDTEIEEAIAPLFNYLNDSLAVLWECLNPEAFSVVMLKIWKEILSVIESLLIPPLSDKSTSMKPLSVQEVYIVLRWLKALSAFLFNDGTGVPLEDLHNQKYRQICSIPLFYHMNEDELMMEAHRAVKARIAEKTKNTTVRSKSVVQRRNLGTIKRHKLEKEKRQEKDGTSAEMMLCILRMRPNTGDFLSQQLQTLGALQRDHGLDTPQKDIRLGNKSLR